MKWKIGPIDSKISLIIKKVGRKWNEYYLYNVSLEDILFRNNLQSMEDRLIKNRVFLIITSTKLFHLSIFLISIKSGIMI